MLNIGSKAGFGLLPPFLLFRFGRLIQRTSLAGTHGHMPNDQSLPVQKRLGLANVADMPCCADERMNQTRVRIDPDRRFHTKVPRIPLFGRMHVGVTFPPLYSWSRAVPQ